MVRLNLGNVEITDKGQKRLDKAIMAWYEGDFSRSPPEEIAVLEFLGGEMVYLGGDRENLLGVGKVTSDNLSKILDRLFRKGQIDKVESSIESDIRDIESSGLRRSLLAYYRLAKGDPMGKRDLDRVFADLRYRLANIKLDKSWMGSVGGSEGFSGVYGDLTESPGVLARIRRVESFMESARTDSQKVIAMDMLMGLSHEVMPIVPSLYGQSGGEECSKFIRVLDRMADE